MSVPSTEQVTGAPISDATDKALTDAEKQAAENPAVPAATPEGDKPSNPSSDKAASDGLDELRSQVATLGETVNTLAGLVEGVVAHGNPDEGAGSKLPLLLRGKKGIPE